MIKYHVSKEQAITEIKVSGHANYARHGEDIVCAAVSTATILTNNALERMGFKENIKVSVRDGFFQIEVVKPNEMVAHLLDNLEDTLQQLEKQYPKYIKNLKEG